MWWFQFACEVCNKTFGLEKNLRKHLKNYHSDRIPSFKCTICKTRFKTAFNLRTHMKNVHLTEIDLLEAKKCNKPIENKKSGKVK